MRIGVSGWVAGTLIVSGSLAACGGDARFDQVVAGISRDSVAVLTRGAEPHHVDSYLIGGRRWEVDFYAKSGADVGDTLAVDMTPVVYSDGVVAGTGWSWWKSKASELKIQLPE